MQHRDSVLLVALEDCGFSEAEVARLAEQVSTRHFYARDTIALQGHEAAYFVVDSGSVAIEEHVNGVTHVVGTAAGGEFIGFSAVSGTEQRLSATLVATSDVDIIQLDSAVLESIVSSNPALRTRFAERAERILIERLVRATVTVDAAASAEMRGLLGSVHRLTASAGERIISQGDAGNEAYVVVDGLVDVIDESTQRVLASLGPGSLFGEASLLSNVPRNATVRATAETMLLVLGREPLLNFIEKNAAAKARMIDLLNSRDRPARKTDIEVYRQRGADGQEIAVLKNAELHKYFRLSGDSLFVWERCDGANTIRDLAMALFMERQHFAPNVIISTVTHLRAEGFLQSNAASATATFEAQSTALLDRILLRAKRILTATAHFDNVDGMFGAVYRLVGAPLFSRRAAVALGLLGVAGVVLFALSSTKAIALLWTPHGLGIFFIMLFPAYALLIILHEFGHGLAVKAIGRSVTSAGVGWYWFGPVAFVDTSDAWAGTRAQRILVSAAGPAANVLLGALAAAVAYWSTLPLLTIAAWQFALAAYIGVIENLNPLLEFDGYYILVDLLDRPNLRRDSLRWMGSEFGNVCRRPSVVRGHVIECSYAVGAIAYIVFACAQTTLFYHVVGQARLALIMPGSLAALLAWALPAALAVIAFAALLGEMRKITDGIAK